jgi:hypothetical protein
MYDALYLGVGLTLFALAAIPDEQGGERAPSTGEGRRS